MIVIGVATVPSGLGVAWRSSNLKVPGSTPRAAIIIFLAKGKKNYCDTKSAICGTLDELIIIMFVVFCL